MTDLGAPDSLTGFLGSNEHAHNGIPSFFSTNRNLINFFLKKMIGSESWQNLHPRGNLTNLFPKKKQKRHKLMFNLQKSINFRKNTLLMGRKISTLVKGISKFNKNINFLNSNKLYGKSKYGHVIHFYGSIKLIGKIINLKITSVCSLCIYGKLI